MNEKIAIFACEDIILEAVEFSPELVSEFSKNSYWTILDVLEFEAFVWINIREK